LQANTKELPPKPSFAQPGKTIANLSSRITEIRNLLNWMHVNHVPIANSEVQWFAKDANRRLLIINNCTKIEWYDAPSFSPQTEI
jgi:hypothetical protein